MEEYQKIKKIQRLTNLVGCLKKFPSGKIEIFLISIQIILIILCIMNVLIIPFNELKIKPLFGLRIVIIAFSSLSLIICILNKICRKNKKLNSGYGYCIGLFGSLCSLVLNCIDFLFLFIALIITQSKLKSYSGNKKYDSSSILAIDIFSLFVMIILFFFWYVEIFLVYSKLKNDQSIKEYIDSKIRFYQSQNAKVVNVEINEKFDVNNNNIQKIKASNTSSNVEDDDIISSNKMDINEEKQSEGTKEDKDDNISNKEENNITNDLGK